MTEDLVRILRVVEYTGPRSAVEKAVSLSVHGERRYGPRGAEITVRAATIGGYPEILGAAAAAKVYATGWDDGQGSIGMCDGPTPNLNELLDRQPPTDDLDTEGRTAYIYEFEDSGSDGKTLYAWIDGGWEPL